MYKVNGFFRSSAGPTRRQLDFRVPEDRLSLDHGVDGILRSPAVDRWVYAFHAADMGGDEYGMRVALNGVIDAHRANLATAGVPVYAHPPLPTDFVDSVLESIDALPESHRQVAFNTLIAAVEPNSKPMVAQQLSAQKSGRDSARLGVDERDPDSAEARRRADELDERDPIAALAHPIAYGGDTAMDDLFGEEGLFGDWGWRREIPPPSGAAPRIVGEGTRFFLGSGPGGAGLFGRGARGVGVAAKGASRSRTASGAAKGGPRTSQEAARSYVSYTKCNCHPLKGSGATCPSRVAGGRCWPEQGKEL